ncbi:NIMA (never in mitosis gene a)-related kinase [Rhizoctonia solani AG-1 IB]|uniref:non-specific serine/threonine protein kinase n=1 Tax=Thanatephorus cucumeris (strain AG1-IB / isolate 7/3/14) TaxID=1108050 RepID=M5BPH4_THACB|nr:NIMA (never in mitosis gene a)-related kinase [Rhizoctonia solani AG-1 IB]
MSSVLDDYEAGDVIGNGSFGLIRKVRRKADGALFARKELNFERMTERDRKQIVAEVNILKDLKHDHIVRYHDRYVDRDNGILYILMETSSEGSSLVQPRPTQQILHRDLKPENVFLDSEGYVKLGDFGLAKQIGYATFTQTYVGPAMRPSAQQLLQHERIEFAFKMTEAQKLATGLRIRKTAIMNKEREVAERENALLLREATINSVDRGTFDAECAAFKAAQIAFASERAIFMEERNALNIERAALGAEQLVLSNERAVFTAEIDQEREAFAKEKEGFAQEVQNVRKAFAAQVEEMRAEKERLDARKEAAAAVVEMRTKKPLEEQKESRNAAGMPPLMRYTSYDETPSRPTQKANGFVSKNYQTPIGRRLASRSMTNLGSAMRGVVLTDSGEQIPTPTRGGTAPSSADITIDERPTSAPIPIPQPVETLEPASLERSLSEGDPPKRLARRSTVGPAGRPIGAPATTIQTSGWDAPPPVYDPNDEENLPSPFLKRGKTEIVKGKKVPGLLQLATGNAAKVGTTTTRTGVSSTLRAGTKASLMRAVKASESVTKTLSSKR